MLNEIQPLRKRRFLSTARTTTTVTATAAATPPTTPPTTEDIELGAVSDDAEVELAFKCKRLHISPQSIVFLRTIFLKRQLPIHSQTESNFYVVSIYSLKVCLQMAIRFMTVIYQII